MTEGKKKVTVAGCRCTKGSLSKRKKFRVVRGTDTVYDGNIESPLLIPSSYVIIFP